MIVGKCNRVRFNYNSDIVLETCRDKKSGTVRLICREN